MTDDAEDELGMAPPGSYSESDRPQCTASTVDGRRCEGVVVPGLEVCHRHLGQSDDFDHRGDRDDEDEDDRDDLDEDVQAVLDEHPPSEVLEGRAADSAQKLREGDS